ncbi:YwgA family protein [Sporosarcina thermotolerans]|uniref:YwgA family protein n=1 Tax=Sporosarcina thermotolerans TaxID=633404 RepID=A0AAW9A697_9BACL|nr:YwgA family protein [Sporosarcina thermotolerans]MDW0116435.1 YwgA family protein [Sporosarcina thermotolerans]WHT48383.1 YwgA family protein [Sporosarcina thermotolerans]
MLQEHAKIVQFIAMANEVNGRKKLQKMIYIAKKMDFPFAEKYELHMYGPYSEELTLRVEELCEMGFLAESCEDKGSYVQYSYNVTEEGERFVEMAESPHASLDDLLSRLNGKSSRFLELVSTLLYFDYLPKDEQIAKVHIVKNKLNFSEDEMNDAFAFIAELPTCSTVA